MGQTHQKTLDQQRARQAWENIQEVVRKDGGDLKKKYGGLARKVPFLILTNGLGQTLAFLRAKGKDKPEDAHHLIYGHISRWTMSQIPSQGSEKDLLKWVLSADSASYRRASVEALAFLNWLKRFAEAELPAEEG
ncbi:MAG: type III-B CRISPR module-associated protein Cmr5 [bacterium JZ-2024 1]